MIMERMQLVTKELLLLRYEERKKDSDVTPLLPTPRRLYVFYNIASEEVVGVYHDDSVDLLQIILQFYDQMSNVRSMQTGDAPPCRCIFFSSKTLRMPANRYPLSVMRHYASIQCSRKLAEPVPVAVSAV